MSDQDVIAESEAPAAPPPRCPPFAPARLERQLALDAAARWGLFGLLVLAVLVGPALEPPALRWLVLGALAAGAVWMSLVNTRAAQGLGRITALLDKDAAAAEGVLATTLARWPVLRGVRVLLYHRLAVLRRRQDRCAEAALICQSLLAQHLGAAERVPGAGLSAAASPGQPPGVGPLRAHLLLMLADCQLTLGDLWAAHRALLELHRGPLGLTESLQRLAIQSRYEVAAGYQRLALHNLAQKVRLAELMPPPQCAALHALWAHAARKAGETPLAAWLEERAQLLGAQAGPGQPASSPAAT